MKFSVLMELHEKCMISIFPYVKIVRVANFMVNAGNELDPLDSLMVKSFCNHFFVVYSSNHMIALPLLSTVLT